MRDWLDFAAVDFAASLLSLAAVAVFALFGWLLSLARRDVSIVDSLWSLMFLISLTVYMVAAGSAGWRAWLVLSLVAIWAVRLSAYITWRGWGEPEDRRYREIRENNQPNFRFKSLYIVFGLQASLAWIISFPMLAAASKTTGPTWLDALGVVLWIAGMVFETVGDAQLSRFKRNPANRGKVMKSGLWRYTRHPNYFGEFLLQWGLFLVAVAAGGAWTVFAPILITFLLLRVSGVSLLEKDISERRPEYREYAERTNSFFPGKPRIDTEHALFIALALIIALPWMAAPASANGIAIKADREWNFQVLVDGKAVGHHRFYLDHDDDTRKVTSVADFEYRLLFLKLYDYEHQNREVWEGECLARIESTTNDNGDRFTVDGEQKAEAFVVESGPASRKLPKCVKSFAYWNPEFLEAPRLLNSQNGEYVEADLAGPVPDEIQVNGAMLETQRYRLDAGEYEIELWYTPEREWVGLQTRAGEGRSLRYVLQ